MNKIKEIMEKLKNKSVALYMAVRIAFTLGVITLLVLLFFFIVGLNANRINGYMMERRAENYMKELEEKESIILEKYKTDTYGSTTPEGTLDLYIAALESGDIEEASRYYNPEYQEDKKKELTKVYEKDKFEMLFKNINLLKDRGVKRYFKKEVDNDKFSIVYKYKVEEEYLSDVEGRSEQLLIPKGYEETISIGFTFNKDRNIWKILNQ